MKTIVMDSANKYLVVALYENQKCLASLQEEGKHADLIQNGGI